MDLLKDFEVLNIVTLYDHFPIILTLHCTEIYNDHSKCKKLHWKDERKEIYTNKMYFSNNIAEVNIDVNLMNKNLINTITLNASFAGMHSTTKQYNAINPWFCVECERSKINLKNLLKKRKNNDFRTVRM